MPSTVLSQAIREAYASAQSDIFYLDTLEIANPAIATLYIVADRVDHFLKLETGHVVQFLPCGFRFTLPATGENGIQELSLAIDNVNRQPSDFIRKIVNTPDSTTVTYRPYVNTDLDNPAMNPPLILFLSDIIVTPIEVTARASFADILNRSFLSKAYTRRAFPGL